MTRLGHWPTLWTHNTHRKGQHPQCSHITCAWGWLKQRATWLDLRGSYDSLVTLDFRALLGSVPSVPGTASDARETLRFDPAVQPL